jgi:hypothetical protein
MLVIASNLTSYECLMFCVYYILYTIYTAGFETVLFATRQQVRIHSKHSVVNCRTESKQGQTSAGDSDKDTYDRAADRGATRTSTSYARI